MRIGPTGAVGIGTSAPQAPLHVRDNSRDVLKVSGVNGIQSITTGANAWLNVGTHDGATQIMSWYNSANTPMGAISATGAVGIGTNTPAALLHIRDTNIDILKVGYTTRLQTVTTGNGGWANFGTNDASIPIMSFYNSSAAQLGVLSATGSLGLGTNPPATLVHLKTSTDSNSGITIEGGTHALRLGVDATHRGFIQHSYYLGLKQGTTTVFSSSGGAAAIGNVVPSLFRPVTKASSFVPTRARRPA